MIFVETHVAGDTLDFRVEVPDYPNTDAWALKYRLVPRAAGAPILITAANNADGSYQIQEGPAVTALWAPGFYTWSRWVEKSGARQTLTERGQLEIRPDPATLTAGTDTRTHNQKVLDSINAVIESRATRTQRELVGQTIGIRSQQFDQQEGKAALMEFKGKYEWLVRNETDRERMKAGKPNPRNVGARFTKA